jgi:predicted short-subunit dehydrogenase-like oxidoreductase (DUF2520 family)
VVAGNFATTLLAEASGLLAAAGVPAEEAPALLVPLAIRSLQNAVSLGPARALTGPVVRRDTAILDEHRAVMAELSPDTIPVYEALVRATWRLAAHKNDPIRADVD